MKKLNTAILFLSILLASGSSHAVMPRNYTVLQQTCYNMFFYKFPKYKNSSFERTIKLACLNINSAGALSCAQKSFSTFSWIDWSKLLAACGTIDHLSTYDYCAKDVLNNFHENTLRPLIGYYAMKKTIYALEECGRND